MHWSLRLLNRLRLIIKGLKKLLNHTAKGVDYYVVMGTTGESATCKEEEKKKVLEFVKENNPSNLPNSIWDWRKQYPGSSRFRQGRPISKASMHSFRKPILQQAIAGRIVQHFRASLIMPVPVILYNVPGRTSSNITAETTLRLAEHQNIIGTKEASGKLEQCMRIANTSPKDFLLISGDECDGPIYSIGGKGVISVLANAYPVTFEK